MSPAHHNNEDIECNDRGGNIGTHMVEIWRGHSDILNVYRDGDVSEAFNGMEAALEIKRSVVESLAQCVDRLDKVRTIDENKQIWSEVVVAYSEFQDCFSRFSENCGRLGMKAQAYIKQAAGDGTDIPLF